MPLVISHAAEPWRGPTRFSAAVGGPSRAPLLAAPLPLDFEFLLDDLTRCSDAELLERGRDAIARLTWLALRHGREEEQFFPRLLAAIRALQGDLRGSAAPAALVSLASYVCQVTNAPFSTVRATIAGTLEAEVRSPFMAFTNVFQAEGHKEGVLEARRESLTLFLEARFGPLDAGARARIAAAAGDQLVRWIRRSAVAPSIAEALDG